VKNLKYKQGKQTLRTFQLQFLYNKIITVAILRETCNILFVVVVCRLLDNTRIDYPVPPPFSQIDIIAAMMIVWRVRGKIIRSVLCSIVCNNCAQCSAYTYGQS